MTYRLYLPIFSEDVVKKVSFFDNIQLYSHEVADSDDACEIFEDVPDKGSELGVKIGSSSSSRFLLPKYMTSLLALKQTVPSENIFRER